MSNSFLELILTNDDQAIAHYAGKGSLATADSQVNTCDFEAVQLADGMIFLVCDGLPPSFNPFDIHPTHFVGTTVDGLNLSSERFHVQIEANVSPTRVVFSLGELVVVTSNPVPAMRVRFGLTNFTFIGNAVEQTGSGIHRVLLLQLRNLPNALDVKIVHVERYHDIVGRLGIRNDIAVTCEAEIELSQCPDPPHPTEIVSNLCYVLSVAAGTKIQWIYYCEYSPLNQPVRRVHAARVTKRYTSLPVINANDGHYNFQTFVERTYPAYVEKRGTFRLDGGTIDAYLDARAAGDYLETRGVKLAIALETLKSVLVCQPDISFSRFVMPERTFAQMRSKFQDALRSILKEQGIENEARASIYGNLLELNHTSFRRLIEQLCAYIDLIVEPDDIKLFVECRNKLVHEGRFYCTAATSRESERCQPLASSLLEYMFLVNFLDRIFLKLLDYGGPYIEWRSGRYVHQDHI
jgi:hypothetical protein